MFVMVMMVSFASVMSLLRLTYCQVRALSNVVASSTQPIQNLRVLQHIGDKQQQQEWARKWITDGLTGFEKMVADVAGKHCIGDTLTMADLCLVPQLLNAKRFGVDMTAFPIINRIAENCRQLEAFKAGTLTSSLTVLRI
ncbi:maiA [Bugula neritina]|uniref:MaiA n=1 Tax=Bugula neritina TaxID=10212 RepID=A0A7J7KEA1_BUGNE|nr:maiA [Bugula neritina]